MIEFEILVDGSEIGLEIEVVYQPSRSMPPHEPGPQSIDEVWQESLARAHREGLPLYDGKLFRLEHFATNGNRLRLCLGETSYKEYVATRRLGSQPVSSREHLAGPLAVCAALTTSDGRILVERRQNTDVYTGRYHVIGGFFERDKDGRTMPQPAKAVQREVREETGLRLARGRFVCLGLVRDLTTPHPELCFTAAVADTFAKVRRRQVTDGELRNLESVEASPDLLRAFILANHGNISATGEPCLLLYGKHRFGAVWYDELLAAIK